MYKIINGIQHIGIGVKNLEETWSWYRKFFGLDIPLFNNVNDAPLMQNYNRGNVIRKKAVLALNIKGGIAVEIVQPVSFEAEPFNTSCKLGDLGILISKVRTSDIQESYNLFLDNSVPTTEVTYMPDGRKTFYVKDINNLYYQIVESSGWFANTNHVSGGMLGTVIGVSDMEKSLNFYQNIMGFTEVLFDEEGVYEEYKGLIPGADERYRRVLLTQPKGTTGNWGKLGGKTEIELIQALDRPPVKIFKGKQWGDTGFIHLGFDAKGVSELEKDLTQKGHPYTCDSKDVLEFGNTKVHCVYIEDPDNTLIELIEVYKVPLIEKWGLYMDVEKRNPSKPLPSFMLKLMKFNRVKSS